MAQENYLDRDNEGHWYVIPRDMETEWQDFLELDPDDEDSWEAPDWAVQVGGSHTLVSFTSFRID